MTVDPALTWPNAIKMLRPYVVKITTPRGSGTGFLVSASKANVCAVATAAHVVDHAHYWDDLIRIHHQASGKSSVLRPGERAVFLNESIDTAAILFTPGDIPFPESPLPMSPEGKYLVAGAEIGWVGYPAIASSTLCFFSGRISGMLESDKSYLVDGVAINGVSGGPAVWAHGSKLTLMGVVSAYIPNRATGETLPGLCVIRDVEQFQEVAKQFKTLDDARQSETPPPETPPPPVTPG